MKKYLPYLGIGTALFIFLPIKHLTQTKCSISEAAQHYEKVAKACSEECLPVAVKLIKIKPQDGDFLCSCEGTLE